MFGTAAQQATQRLGKLSLTVGDQAIDDGEQIHAALFTGGQIKVPQQWIGIASYF